MLSEAVVEDIAVLPMFWDGVGLIRPTAETAQATTAQGIAAKALLIEGNRNESRRVDT